MVRTTYLGGCVLAGILAVATVTALSGPAAAFQPRDAREHDAVNVRILQSEMMVAALTCDMRERYNTAVSRYESELVAHAQVLKSMFRRDHGASARKALDGFITQLANDASIRSIRTRQDFCASAGEMFATILSGDAELAEIGLRTVEQAVVQREESR